MKKSKRILAGTGLILSLSLLSGCSDISTRSLYGPPPITETPEITTKAPAVTELPAPVYGPPKWIDPAEEEVVDVYGPPEWFDHAEEEVECVYGPPMVDD